MKSVKPAASYYARPIQLVIDSRCGYTLRLAIGLAQGGERRANAGHLSLSQGRQARVGASGDQGRGQVQEVQEVRPEQARLGAQLGPSAVLPKWINFLIGFAFPIGN